MTEKTPNFFAALNLKEQPASLTVLGSTIVFTADARIRITALHGGLNQKIHLLKLEVEEGSGPRKGIEKKFSYGERGPHLEKIEQVTIEFEDCTTVTEDVMIMG